MNEGANSNPVPPGGGEPVDGFPTEEEFSKWMENPDDERRHIEHLQQMVAGLYGDTDLKLVELAGAALVIHLKRRALRVVREKFVALGELMNRPGGTMEAEERLRQCNALLDELTDALLETPEPYRTKYLKELLPIREQVRALRV